MITASVAGWAAKDIPDIVVLWAYNQRSKPLPGAPHEEIARATGAPVKVVLAACERAHKRGLIEYGVAIGSGFVTEKGRAILALSATKPAPRGEEVA